MKEEIDLVKKAEEEYWRLFKNGFGIVGHSGDSRATAAYLAKIFTVGDAELCIETAVEAYAEDKGYLMITPQQQVWLEEGIAHIKNLKEAKGITRMPLRYVDYIQDKELWNRLANGNT